MKPDLPETLPGCEVSCAPEQPTAGEDTQPTQVSQAAILDALAAHIALLDRNGKIVAVNASWRRFGSANGIQDADCFVGRNYMKACGSATGDAADGAEKIAAGLRAVLAGQLSRHSMEYPCHTPTEKQWYRVTATPLFEGRQEGAVIMHVNITRRKLVEIRLHRLNRLHTVLSRMGEAIMRTGSRQELYEATCRIAVEDGLLQMAAIMEPEHGTGRIRTIASFGDERGYLHDMVVTADGGEHSLGTVGTALRNGVHDICNDFANDPRMEPWREKALRRGFQSTASFPLKTDGRVVGALVLFAGEAGYFQEDEVKLLASVAEEISFALGSLEKERLRLAAEEALRSSEANMAAAQRIAHIGSWELDLTGLGTLRWSDEMFRIAGFEPGAMEISRELFFSLVPEEDREGIRNAVAEAIRNRHPYSIVHRLIRPDGVERIVRESAEIAWDPSTGKPLSMIGTAHDITGRRRGEQALRASEQQFSSAFEHAPIGIGLLSPEGRWLKVNSAVCNMLGYTASELLEMTFQQIAPPEDVDMDLENIHRLLDGTIAIYEREKRYIHKDGRHVWALLSVAIAKDEAGCPIHFIAHIQDITDRKVLEQQFLRAQRIESIGTLAGGIAHDLNNVLAPIMMSIDLLRDHITDPNALDILDLVGKSARRGADMVGQVLTFARGVEGGSEEMQVSEIIQDLLRIVRDTFPKNIQTESDVGSELWLVTGDPTQIHQVLLNLCVNSRDAMPEGGIITLKAENVIIDEHYAAMNLDSSPGPYLKIGVEDTGHGIPSGIIDRLFDPFFTTKEIGKGTGLGLSTSLAIIKSHGGFIRAYSDPGEGARFRIYLPALPGAGAGEPVPEKTSLPRAKGETVLVVDDEASIRQITRQTLEAFGYKVLLAADGTEAISLYVQHLDTISVVLTDMMMPLMDGPAVIRVILRINPRARIIGASGITAKGRVTEAATAGLEHFLPKPYTAETMLRMLRKVIDG